LISVDSPDSIDFEPISANRGGSSLNRKSAGTT